MFDWLFGWVNKPEYTWTFVEDRLPQLTLGVLLLAVVLGAVQLHDWIKYRRKK